MSASLLVWLPSIKNFSWYLLLLIIGNDLGYKKSRFRRYSENGINSDLFGQINGFPAKTSRIMEKIFTALDHVPLSL